MSSLRERLDTMDIGEKARTEAEIERLQQVITEFCGGIITRG